MSKAIATGVGVALAVVGVVLIMAVPCDSRAYEASVTWAIVAYVAGALVMVAAAARGPVSLGGRVVGAVLAAAVTGGVGFFFGFVGTFRCWEF